MTSRIVHRFRSLGNAPILSAIGATGLLIRERLIPRRVAEADESYDNVDGDAFERRHLPVMGWSSSFKLAATSQSRPEPPGKTFQMITTSRAGRARDVGVARALATVDATGQLPVGYLPNSCHYI